MIPKKEANTSNIDNLRPISLLSCIGKLYERFILSENIPFIDIDGRLPATQFGFRTKLTAPGQTINLFNISRNTKYQTIAVLLDLRKAFDSVWREAILHMAAKIGISPNILRLIYILRFFIYLT